MEVPRPDNRLVAGGYVDCAFAEEHTVGFEELARTVQAYPPERIKKIADIPVAELRRAAETPHRAHSIGCAG